MAAKPPTEFAEDVASRLGEVEGVAAVVLGGSWARREAHPDSDVDLGIYYRSGHRPSVAALRRLAREMDDRQLPELVTNFGEWGPWIDGGGWLQIRGCPVDWLYRDLDLMERVISECQAGKTGCHYQPGHPHGFHDHIYLGEIHHCKPLYDPNGELSALKRFVEDYPPSLRRTVVEKYLWEASFALDTCRKPAERGDVFYVTGCLFRSASCLVQVLFALNERYFVNEKGAVEAVESLGIKPEGFSGTISETLAEPGNDAAGLRASTRRFERLLQSVRGISTEYLREANL